MDELKSMPMSGILDKFPFAADWFAGFGFEVNGGLSFEENVAACDEDFFTEIKMSRREFSESFYEYINAIMSLLGSGDEELSDVTILPGRDKDGVPERFAEIKLNKGDVVAVVGETGSGKSRFLSDVEWGAEGDTPTKRRILFNGKPLARSQVGKNKKKMVAQLSQNMNFVIDMSVLDFIEMHSMCWLTGDRGDAVEKVFVMANELSGEPFRRDTAVTSLSGGQSRALMIADCAILSEAPVVLIDEIENAGINRRKALELLTGEDKIVFIATHDPVLALLADHRIIIKNGGITDILSKDPAEQAVLEEVEALDRRILDLRERLRRGERLGCSCGGKCRHGRAVNQ